jgi:transposase-like protein
MTRADDEKLLRAIYLCVRGNTIRTAARAINLAPSTLSKAISRVRDEDCIHDPSAITYWQKHLPHRKDVL